MFFVFKQKTAYEMRISDWSSDVCSSDLRNAGILLADLAVVLFLVLQAFGRRVLGQHRLEIQDLAKLHVAVVERVRPFDDRVEGQRALAQAQDHRVAARLDALRDGDLALAADRQSTRLNSSH